MAEIFKASGDRNTYSVTAPNLSAKFVSAIDKRELDRPFGYAIGWGDGTTAEIFTTAVNSASFSNLLGNRMTNAVNKALAEAKSRIPATPQFDFTNLVGRQGDRGPQGPQGPRGLPGVGLTTWQPTNWINSSERTVPNTPGEVGDDELTDDTDWGIGIKWIRLVTVRLWAGVTTRQISAGIYTENQSGHTRIITLRLKLRRDNEDLETEAGEPSGIDIGSPTLKSVADGESTQVLIRAGIVEVPRGAGEDKYYNLDLIGSVNDYGLIITRARNAWINVWTMGGNAIYSGI